MHLPAEERPLAAAAAFCAPPFGAAWRLRPFPDYSAALELKDANMYPWSIQSLGSFLVIHFSQLLTSLVQSIIKYSEFPCS